MDINVAITMQDKESDAILEGLQLIHAEQLINEEDVVVITPNWVNGQKPDPKDGVVVGQESLRTIIRWVKDRNAKRIVVATGSGGGDTLEIMKKVGYEEVIQSEGVEFIDFNSGPYEELEINHSIIKKLKVNKIINEKTKLISFTQLKHHEESTMSASIKNIALSIPSTEEHGSPKKDLGIHEDLHGFIYKMAENIPITLSIISCNPAMVGSGPTKGIPFHTGIVICGNDCVASDTIGARLLGFKPQAIRYLYQLEKEGNKETDVNKFNITGMKLEDAEKHFSETVYNKGIMVDKN